MVAMHPKGAAGGRSCRCCWKWGYVHFFSFFMRGNGDCLRRSAGQTPGG
ncbi:hypothetical protein BRYFOR_05111 [Marvinbryantia formatexigens DSM 14469]|uniref:Uncharacterized protein n=1 Tax=Marvinbryantia formatexigens DSM 14469 TaxID=478749 RepID=C6L921_9FIRM|nr:hypothetical protein BRYFOR_05111 [Marvinbryantia formatexigens DSM 14469]